ncbi:MAG: hypothetical protein OXI17_15795 [Gammaproteobacteria bacterium]|nr:hypothetical protein [Gammaproteobacteria bacterium]
MSRILIALFTALSLLVCPLAALPQDSGGLSREESLQMLIDAQQAGELTIEQQTRLRDGLLSSEENLREWLEMPGQEQNFRDQLVAWSADRASVNSFIIAARTGRASSQMAGYWRYVLAQEIDASQTRCEEQQAAATAERLRQQQTAQRIREFERSLMDDYSILIDAGVPPEMAYDIVRENPGTLDHLHQVSLAEHWMRQQGVDRDLLQILEAGQ